MLNMKSEPLDQKRLKSDARSTKNPKEIKHPRNIQAVIPLVEPQLQRTRAKPRTHRVRGKTVRVLLEIHKHKNPQPGDLILSKPHLCSTHETSPEPPTVAPRTRDSDSPSVASSRRIDPDRADVGKDEPGGADTACSETRTTTRPEQRSGRLELRTARSQRLERQEDEVRTTTRRAIRRNHARSTTPSGTNKQTRKT